jgi:hypothetical protein
LDGFRNKTQHKHNKSVTQILHFDRYFAKKFKQMKFKLLFFTLLHSYFFSQSKGTITGTLTDKEANNQSLPLQTFLLKEQV